MFSAIRMRWQRTWKGIDMNQSKKKTIMFAVAACLLTAIYVVYNTIGVDLGQKTIMHFMTTTIAGPAVILIVYGILVGKGKKLVQVFPQLFGVSLVVFIISCTSMFYMYHTEYIFQMLNNTATNGNIVLNINESITIGTVVQQALIFLVCSCVGSGIGNKAIALLDKVKN